MATTTPALPRLLPVGSVGSRIRVVFGDSGDEWLLLLDHDDGNSKWQSKNWKGIPNTVAKQLNNCTNKGRDAKVVDFGPSGAWYINGEKSGGTNGHSWWGNTTASDSLAKASGTHQVSFGSDDNGNENFAIIQGRNGYTLSYNIPSSVSNRLGRIRSGGKKVHFLRLFHHGKFVLQDDEARNWALSNEPLEKELRKTKDKVEEVAVAGDGSWLVVRTNNYVSSRGVDKALTDMLTKFFNDQRRWINNITREIRETKERIAREESERQARLVREEEERHARERERLAQERTARERREREAIEAAERAEKEALELAATARMASLEAKLEERLFEEAKDIKETEKILRTMETNLQKRKRSFHASLQDMPLERRARLSLDVGDTSTTAVGNTNRSICVVCQDEPAELAVVPCGHVCLCCTCSDAFSAGEQFCPLCRGKMQNTLKIFLGI